MMSQDAGSRRDIMLVRLAGILGAAGLAGLAALSGHPVMNSDAAGLPIGVRATGAAPALAVSAVQSVSPRARCSGEGSFDDPYMALEPQLAMSADGHAVITWARKAPGGWVVEAASAAPGAPWGAPAAVAAVSLAPADNLSACSVSVAMGARDDAVAAWTVNRDTDTALVQLASRDAGGAWSAPQTITAPGEVYGAAVAMNRNGDAVAAWWRVADSAMLAEVSTRASGGAWSAPTAVASAPNTIDVPAITPVL